MSLHLTSYVDMGDVRARVLHGGSSRGGVGMLAGRSVPAYS